MSLFRYGGLRIELPKGYEYVYYSTFIVGEYDFLRFKKEDTVLDAGAFVGDFTVKIARKVKEVVAVEPLPWAFEILKRNVEVNELKNVILVNKALYDVDGIKIRISDEGVGSKVSNEGIEVTTTTIESLGKFSVVKMDIEGTEGRLIKGNWLNSVREIAMELHGNENVISIPATLRDKGFNVRFMKWSDVVKNSVKNISLHPMDFLKAEMKTWIMSNAIKGFLTRNKGYTIPSLTKEEFKILYGRRL